MSKTIFDKTVIDDLKMWAKHEPKLIKKVFELIDNIHQTPFGGLGKPEPLKYDLKCFWSRRITDEHRLVYRVLDNADIEIISVHGHYEK